MERLQKVMAHAGVASRRKCEEIILAGRVKVNGETINELGKKVEKTDIILVDGQPIFQEKYRYIMLYKPRGVISSVEDEHQRKVVTDYIEQVQERLYPIGRLDYDTSGLILLTNDGEFANLLMHPRYEVEKIYVAKVEGLIGAKALQTLSRGVELTQGTTAAAQVKVLSSGVDNSIVQLTIHQGWNHQVKNMFQAVGHPVLKLKREGLSFLTLENLQPGQWRDLTAFEVDKLKKIALQV